MNKKFPDIIRTVATVTIILSAYASNAEATSESATSGTCLLYGNLECSGPQLAVSIPSTSDKCRAKIRGLFDTLQNAGDPFSNSFAIRAKREFGFQTGTSCAAVASLW
ncbi:MAG: hypothetical protein ACD_16C00001G0007 [uncultured bacterium]|nr:MAG: hypothetical protein ACD_16C00001G0007 [uncultured bacterium]OFW74543.1 MAG: hypothetical protein A2Z80_00535 [Alphaproteobacteria bacterium GWA2_41_27]OFW84616.1 MAG: hypothetical protein A2W06_07575 [Alphaproteobacteria bacterium RBG_16_42_14]OFW84625.1 MAG: hypothetical protein A3E50_06665 [Alphaproteobacteria bacterium RIFCSPHIGHO2_12_FULL_42_100]OFW92626.1 MAG: hypothetical protein A2W46_06495 [Alphaproteobacteria bacterium RIFCSPHIGHO2_12_42_13]OFW92646.1 MAG: hypothetical protei